MRATFARRRPFVGWSLGILLLALAVGLRMLLARPLAGYPFLTFFPAVMLTAFVGGWEAAAAVALASAPTAWFLFMGDGAGHSSGDWLAVAIFLAIAAIDVALIAGLSQALGRAEREHARAESLAESHRALFRELQHRVANNMQFVSSLLSLQSRRVTDAESGRTALREAMRRLDTLARVHRRLYDPTNAGQDAGALIEELCRDLIAAAGAERIACRVEIGAVPVRMEKLTALSLIVTELVTNALKHAFADGGEGVIAVTLRPSEPGRLRLEVRDDGRGPQDAAAADPTQKLGTRIVQSLAQQLGGRLVTEQDGGMVARVDFDA